MAKPIRCAIYTRKSTEEGLEQAFNSLDAQREACAAYIASQRHEGWTELPDRYDDGGFSGGNMERPGLKQLMADVASGTVDVIVVYKVDRLTRALADFARIVDVLDKAGASFVSVTQAFNTTTSMGRLTLNVLLSFAQFEREVTGERIRDKIAASKAKGMWMGGPVPLGYVVVDRKLVVKPGEAETVRHIMRRYLELGSVADLADDLAASGLVTKRRPLRDGSFAGGVPYSRGGLFHLLANPLYVGEVHHKGRVHAGQHDAIVERALWDQVQAALADKAPERKRRTNIRHPSLLAGLVHDGHGRRMTPSHTVKQAKRYRYYMTQHVEPGASAAWRVPAHDLQQLVIARLCRHFAERNDDGDIHDHDASQAEASQTITVLRDGTDQDRVDQVRALVQRVDIEREQVSIALLPDAGAETPIILTASASLVRSGRQTRLVPAGEQPTSGRRDEALVRLVATAHTARRACAEADTDITATAAAHGFTQHYFAQLARLGGLAPDIVTAILEGRQPASLTRTRLARTKALPLNWADQRTLLGFA